MSEINFLSRRQTSLTRVDKQDLRYRRYALTTFVIALVVFLAAAGSNIFLTRQLSQVNTQERLLTSQIANDEAVEISYLVFSQKLQSVEEIYQNRSNKQQAIDFFSNIFGSQVFLSGMNYEQGKNSLSLRLTSENVFAFDTTLDILNSEEVKNVFSSVEKSGLRRDETGNYNLDISVELKTEGER